MADDGGVAELPEILVTPNPTPASPNTPASLASPFDNGANPFAAMGISAAGAPNAPGLSAPTTAGDPFAGGANPFAEIGLEKPAQPAKPSAGVPLSAAAGINEGVANVLGAPIDLVTSGLNLGIGGINRVTGAAIPQISEPIGGSQSIKDALGFVGMSPDQVPAPQNEAERLARAAGAGASSAILSAGAAPVAEAANLISAPAASLARSAVGAPSLPAAVMGAAAGAGAQAGQDIAPAPLKPLAATVGGMIGGGIPAAAEGGVIGAAALARAGRNFINPDPYAAVGQELLAASSPEGRAALAEGPQEIVPGSQPTLFQQSGDLGLGQWEDAVRTRNRAPFIDRAAEQSAAQTRQLADVQAQGAPQALPEALRAQQAQAVAASEVPVTASAAQLAAAREALARVLPNASPLDTAAHFRAARDAIDAESNLAVHVAAGRAALARGEASPTMTRAEDYGNAIRGPAAEAHAAARDATRALWKAVDPTGRMVLSGTLIKQRAEELEAQLTPSAAPLSGEEKAIFDAAKAYGPKTRFAEVQDLRARVNAAMSQELRTNGRTPAWGRLSQLRGAIEDAIDHAVENQAAEEASAVQRGEMPSSDAIEARIRGWVAEHRAAEISRSQSLGQGPVGVVGARRPPNAGVLGAEGAPSGGPWAAAGSEETAPTLDAATAARLKAASAATKAQKQTFSHGAVGDILKPAGASPEFRLTNAEVPAKVFHSGPTGGEDVRAYAKAVGPQQATGVLSDYAALALRQKAMRPDGTFDPVAVRRFLNDHAAALAELPGVQARFANAAQAEDTVATALSLRKQALAEFDKTAAARIAGLADGSDLVRTIGGILAQKDAAKTLSALNAATAGNPAAREGLQRAVIEHVMDRFIPAVGEPKLAAMDNFVAQNRTTLRRVLTPQQIDELTSRIASVRAAEAGLAAAKGGQAAVLSARDNSIMRQLLGVHDRSDVLDIVGGIFGRRDAVEAMQALAQRAQEAGAMESLKKAVADYVERQFRSNIEAGTTGEKTVKQNPFATFMANNTEALEKVLSPEQVGKLRAIVEDQSRINRSIVAAKLKGQSNTTPDAIASLKHLPKTVLSKLALEAGAAVGGHMVGGPLGAAVGWLGEKAVAGIREAGLARIEKARVEAALRPEKFKAFLDAVPKKPDTGAGSLIGLRARQAALLPLPNTIPRTRRQGTNLAAGIPPAAMQQAREALRARLAQ